MGDKLVYINTELVKNACENGTLAALAFYYKAKLLFNNSTIYKKNSSLRLMAVKFGCSHNVIKKYLAQLETLGLVRRHCGNITFVSLKKTENRITRKNKIAITLTSTFSITQLKSILTFTVLKKNAQQQQFMSKLKTDILSELAYVDVKAKRKYIDKQPREKSYLNIDFVIGNKNLAGKLNTSVQSISSLKKKWKELGLVTFYRQFKKLGGIRGVNNNWYNSHKDNKGVFMSNNGVLYKSLPSKFMLTGVMGSL